MTLNSHNKSNYEQLQLTPTEINFLPSPAIQVSLLCLAQ